MTKALSVAPVHRTFAADQYDDMRRLLVAIQRATHTAEVTDISQLVMDQDGCIYPRGRGHAFRITTQALYYFCNKLAPGLHSLLSSVSGAVREQGLSTGAYSFAEAVSIYNTVLRRRFLSCVSSKLTFLWNAHDRLLEGAYGSRYRCLSNADVIELADSLRQSGRVPLDFSGGLLIGRRLALRYIQPNPLFYITLPDGGRHGYCGGMYFHNSELGGETSVRLATLLTESNLAVSAMSDTLGSRLSHAGRDFNQRVRSSATRLIMRLDDTGTLQARLQALADRPLMLTSMSPDEARNTRILNFLHAKGLSRGMARRVLHMAAVHGSDPAGAIATPALVDIRMLASRTVYDLFYAIIYDSRHLSINLRERAEQVAYGLLTDVRHLM